MNTYELDRVRRSTSAETNEHIDDEIAQTVHDYLDASLDALTARINALEREWDIERLLQTNASIIALTGLVLAVKRDARWLALSGGVLGFLLLHGVQGWCPPLPVLRRLGMRTRGEIDRERFALKFLRGDFDTVRNARGELNVFRLLRALEVG